MRGKQHREQSRRMIIVRENDDAVKRGRRGAHWSVMSSGGLGGSEEAEAPRDGFITHWRSSSGVGKFGSETK